MLRKSGYGFLTAARMADKLLRLADPILCSILQVLLPTRGQRKDLKITYCTQYYTSNSINRQREIEYCISSNSGLKWVDNVIIFCESNASAKHLVASNLVTHKISERLSFGEVFKKIKDSISDPEMIFILSNSDILLDDSILKVLPCLSEHDLIALTRYEHQNDKFPYFIKSRLPGTPSFSQDTWIFKSGLCHWLTITQDLDIPLGVPGCENRLAAVLYRAGVIISNPCLGIKTIHVHDTQERSYTGASRVIGEYAHPQTMTTSQFCIGRRFKPFLSDSDAAV